MIFCETNNTTDEDKSVLPYIKISKAGTNEKLKEAVKFALNSVTSEFIASQFEHCGYST